jgi:hypothetical protein
MAVDGGPQFVERRDARAGRVDQFEDDLEPALRA